MHFSQDNVVITPVKNWSLPKESVVVVKQQPSVPSSETNSMEWTPEYVEWKKLPSLYLKLSKYRLSGIEIYLCTIHMYVQISL